MTLVAASANHRLVTIEEEEIEEPSYWISDELRTRIQREIRARGRIKSKLARRCHVTLGTIQQIESGDIKSTAILPTLSAALGFDWVEYVVPHENQRKLIRALERVTREAGPHIAEQFAAEAEILSRRMIADAQLNGTARPVTDPEQVPIPPR